jgi:hypothetical protein
MSRRPRIQRSDFADFESFARTLHEAGGPDPDERYSFPILTSPYAGLLVGIYGTSPDQLAESDRLVEADEQLRRPHVFVRKWRAGRRKRR